MPNIVCTRCESAEGDLRQLCGAFVCSDCLWQLALNAFMAEVNLALTSAGRDPMFPEEAFQMVNGRELQACEKDGLVG